MLHSQPPHFYTETNKCPICIGNITDKIIGQSHAEQQQQFCKYHQEYGYICKKCSVCSLYFYMNYQDDVLRNPVTYGENRQMLSPQEVEDMLRDLSDINISKHVCIIQNKNICNGCVTVRREIKDKVFHGIYTYPQTAYYKIHYDCIVFYEDTPIRTQDIIMYSPRVNISRLDGLRNKTGIDIYSLQNNPDFLRKMITELYNYTFIPKKYAEYKKIISATTRPQENQQPSPIRIEYNVSSVYRMPGDKCVFMKTSTIHENNNNNDDGNKDENSNSTSNNEGDMPH